MMKKMLYVPMAVMGMVMGLASLPSIAKEQKFVTIGTGSLSGAYYPTGGAMCRLLGKDKDKHNIRCAVESTGGSVYNINAIRNKELDFGITQSDAQYNAYNGTSEFKDQGAFKELRAVFSLHSEAYSVVARNDSNVKTFEDLKGKRFNVGNPGSGNRATTEALMEKLGWKMSDFSLAAELKSSELSAALCDNNIDAYVFFAGHPNGAFQETMTTCDAHFVSVKGEGVDALLKDAPFYSVTEIPGGIYKGNPDATTTFGVKATLVSSTNTDAEVVYQLVKAVFENLDEFKKLHPVLGNLKAEDMVKVSNLAPFHEGAEKYYREVGLIK